MLDSGAKEHGRIDQGYYLRTYPDPILHKQCDLVTSLDGELFTLVDNMNRILKESGGIGLAAPQVGSSLQVALVHIPGRSLLVLVNPIIIQAADSILSTEGCLSLPGVTAQVRRFDSITVEYTNLLGKLQTYQTTGIEAVCIQHEIDHLRGKLINDEAIS